MSDQEFFINARIDNPTDILQQFKVEDPFNKSWNELKNLNGLDNNFKRRAGRLAEKAVAPENMGGYLNNAKAQPSGINGAQSKEINPGSVYRNAYGLFDVITPPWNLYELANYYDTSFANHAAIDAKVENIVGLGYDFEVSPATMLRLESNQDKEQVGRARNRIERAKIELHAWLESLNDNDSFTTTMVKVYTDMQATGNGYLEIGRTTRGEIGYVGHIPATTMRVRRIRDGYVQIIGQKVVYFRNFGAKNPNPITADTRPNEIIHFKQYSPLNTFYGVPDILSAINSLHGDQLASQYNIDYFSNKAVPRYVVTLKGAKLSADAEDKMFRFLQTNLKGQSHRTLYIPLPGDSDTNKVDFKMEPIENGVQEGSFERYRKQNRDDILIAHQVPLSKIGGGDSGGIAAALAQDRTFKEQVARPAQRELEKTLNRIIKEKTDILVLKFNELTLTDENVQSQILERYVKNQVMLPNEARNVLGLPQREGGDEPFQPKPQDTANRARDGERMNNQSDSTATVSGRNPKGEGRSTQ
ncbi:phage portal protein [bacterium]|jgi:PBSX family phage portal protein|nr:phage portal protein [bacterium]